MAWKDLVEELELDKWSVDDDLEGVVYLRRTLDMQYRLGDLMDTMKQYPEARAEFVGHLLGPYGEVVWIKVHKS